MAAGQSAQIADQNQEKIHCTARRIFTAAARILVSYLPAATAVQILKEEYVEQARRKLLRDNGRVTRSAVAALTGIDARQITAMEQQGDTSPNGQAIDAFSYLLERWAQEKEWLDEGGKPLELPIYGSELSFQRLVRLSAGNNVTPQPILQRLIEVGNVELVDNGKRVRMLNRHYNPNNSDAIDNLEVGSLTLGRLATTMVHNAHVECRTKSRRQQDRWSPRIPPERAEEVRLRLHEMLDANIREVEAYLQSVELPVETDVAEEDLVSMGCAWFLFKNPPDTNDQ